MRNFPSLGQKITVTEEFLKTINSSRLIRQIIVGDEIEVGESGKLYSEDGSILVSAFRNNLHTSIPTELYDDMRDIWRKSHGYTSDTVSVVISCAYDQIKVYLVPRISSAKFITNLRKKVLDIEKWQIDEDYNLPSETEEDFDKAVNYIYSHTLEMSSNPIFIEIVEIEPEGSN